MGSDPGSCRLRYRFTGLDRDAPDSIEEAYGTQFNLSKTILEDDRIVVRAMRPDGSWEPIFDGFALGFEASIDPEYELGSIVCVGVAIRANDTPLRGAVWRDGMNPAAISDVRTDVVAHYNPKGKYNCIPDGPGGAADHATWGPLGTDSDDAKYPSFMDPDRPQGEGESGVTPTAWTLSKVARYLCYDGNPDQTYVKNPTGGSLDATLVARVPKDGVTYDPADASTYDVRPIVAPDKPVTGKGWVGVLEELAGDKGFALLWQTGADDSEFGNPATSLGVLFPATADPKDLWLQPRGSVLDLTRTNLGAARITRSLVEVANEVEVQGDMVEWEASFVLACAFVAAAADATDPSQFVFANVHQVGGANADKYRTFVLDESEEGHYLPGTSSLVQQMPDPGLAPLFGRSEGGVPPFVKRRRPPAGTLFSTDARGKPFPYSVSISTDYSGPCPAVWDGSQSGAGTWQQVMGFTLLPNRVGVKFFGKDPNAIHVGKGSVRSDGVLKAVEALAAPSAENPKFYVRLTCVVRSDVRGKYVAVRRPNSPVKESVRRVVEAHDRLKTRKALKNSEFNETSQDATWRDDFAPQDVEQGSGPAPAAAKAEAVARQLALQDGVLDGDVVIPRLTRYYRPGDRIRGINGRNLGLRTNSGGSDVAPVYPVIVEVRHEFTERGQFTHLSLSDANYSREAYTRRAKKKQEKAKGRDAYQSYLNSKRKQSL